MHASGTSDGKSLAWGLNLVLGFALLGCGAGQESLPVEPAFDPTTVEASVSAALGQFHAALAAADYETAVGAYADDERFFWVEDGSIRYNSRDEVRTALAQVQQFGAATYEYGEARIEVLDQHHAMVYVEVKTTFGDPAAGGFSFTVAQTILMAKLGEEWFFLNGHSSSPKQR